MARRLPKRGDVGRSAWSGGGKGGMHGASERSQASPRSGIRPPARVRGASWRGPARVPPEGPVRVYGCRTVRAGLGHIPDKNRFMYMIAGTSAGVAIASSVAEPVRVYGCMIPSFSRAVGLHEEGMREGPDLEYPGADERFPGIG